MKENSGLKRQAFQHAVRSILLGLFLFLPGNGQTITEPGGSGVGTIQFDAVIELNSPSGDSHVLLFARYWVGADFYSMGVVWGEPHGIGLDVSFYPPTLAVASDESGFAIAHDIQTANNGTYGRPIGDRPTFPHVFGSYPVLDIRYADREARTARVYQSDLGSLSEPVEGDEQGLDMVLPSAGDEGQRIVSRAKVHVSEGHMRSMELLDSEQQLIKDIDYEYAKNGTQSYLRRQRITLPEHLVRVGLPGEGMVVRVDDEEYRYTEFDVNYHEGGRTCHVKYEPIALGAQKIVLPVEVTVHNGDTNELLRSARMMNSVPVELDHCDAMKAARKFSGFTEKQRQYRDLLVRNWRKNPEDVSETDVHDMADLQSGFQKALADCHTLGDQLKHLNILMELSRMLGNTSELKRYYKTYLSVLSTNQLHRMVRVGGYNAIEIAMLWGRYREADDLLHEWVEVLSPTFDTPESLLYFANDELRRGHLWTTPNLIDRYLGDHSALSSARLELEIVKCEALYRLDCLLRDRNDESPEPLKAQAKWIASTIGPEHLERMLCEHVEEAAQFSDEGADPIRIPQAAKATLDGIRRQLDQRKPPKGTHAEWGFD
jgi:hypothetical protein